MLTLCAASESLFQVPTLSEGDGVSRHPRVFLIIAIATLTLVLPASASAAPITVGSPLSAAFTAEPINNAKLTAFNSALPEPGAKVISPVSGVVLRWRVLDTKGPHALRI